MDNYQEIGCVILHMKLNGGLIIYLFMTTFFTLVGYCSRSMFLTLKRANGQMVLSILALGCPAATNVTLRQILQKEHASSSFKISFVARL